jgi:hypothetical protein
MHISDHPVAAPARSMPAPDTFFRPKPLHEVAPVETAPQPQVLKAVALVEPGSEAEPETEPDIEPAMEAVSEPVAEVSAVEAKSDAAPAIEQEVVEELFAEMFAIRTAVSDLVGEVKELRNEARPRRFVIQELDSGEPHARRGRRG